MPIVPSVLLSTNFSFSSPFPPFLFWTESDLSKTISVLENLANISIEIYEPQTPPQCHSHTSVHGIICIYNCQWPTTDNWMLAVLYTLWSDEIFRKSCSASTYGGVKLFFCIWKYAQSSPCTLWGTMKCKFGYSRLFKVRLKFLTTGHRRNA